MTRRALLFAALATRLRADSADDVWEVIASAARALCEATALEPPNRGTAAAFLSYFDRKMPGYDTLRDNVTALIAQADLQAALDPVRNDGDDRARDVEIDWTMRVTALVQGMTSTERRQAVKFRVERQGKKWRIVSIAPLAFFAP